MEAPSFHSHFQMYDSKFGVLLSDHFSLHVLELGKWDKKDIEEPIDRWVNFFRDGKHLDDENLPAKQSFLHHGP